ncbi:MAG: RagB/SusD family nutrient uptake outer membrane protein [Lewinella sp.]|nr:RagB/SusD family nutrient uptake outer membrane protein [Lewinella sp.]
MRNIIFKSLALGLVMLSLTGCDYFNFDDPQPINSLPPDLAITNRQSAEAAVAGVYDKLQGDADALTFDGYLSMWQLFSDEAVFDGTFPTRLEFGNFNVFPANTTMASAFTEFYAGINVANGIIETIPKVENTDMDVAGLRETFIGEARFARAYWYLHLTLGWREVPLITTPTVGVGEELNVPTSTQSAIYDQIIEDLEYAAANINPSFSLGITPDAANALLARVALYQGRWQDAYNLATGVLGAGFDLTTYAYLSDDIFSIEFSPTDGNALAFYYGTAELNGRHSVVPSQTLIDMFDDSDVRKDATFGYDGLNIVYGNKYSNFSAAAGTQSDPLRVIRYGEVVLIAAEAAARLNDFVNANLWFGQVRARAGVAPIVLAPANFEDAILDERMRELALESGHRLWDLRRTGKALDVLGPLGYDDCDDVWGLPRREIDRNPNLVQNDCCNC